MKKIIYVVLSTLLIYSCSTDDGNYNYNSTQDINFNMNNEAFSILGEQLQIKGDFTTTANFNNLSFIWMLHSFDISTTTTIVDTISTSKDLNVALSAKPGPIDLYYEVYNKDLNLRSTKRINLQVTTPFTIGWAFLTNKGGSAEYSFASSVNNKFYSDVLGNVSNITVAGNPIKIDFNYLTFSRISNLTIMTDEGGAIIDAASMAKQSDLLDRFNSTDFLNLPFTGGMFNQIAVRALTMPVLFAGGKVYPKSGFYFRDAFWEAPIVGDYEVDGDVVSAIYDKIILFDKLNRRYIYLQGGYSPDLENIFELTNVGAFDPANLNMDCLWMAPQASYNAFFLDQRTISVLKDDSDEYFLQQFWGDFLTTFEAESQTQLPTGSLNKNSVFVNNGIFPFTYMTKDNVIHRFNTTTNGFESDYITTAGNITNLEVNVYGTVMAVVMDEGSGSKVDLLDLLDNGALIKSYTFPDKVIDVKYKEDFD